MPVLGKISTAMRWHRLEILTTQWCEADGSGLQFLSGWSTRKEVVMGNYIETPKMSEKLSEEFMIPFGLSAYKLAQEIPFHSTAKIHLAPKACRYGKKVIKTCVYCKGCNP